MTLKEDYSMEIEENMMGRAAGSQMCYDTYLTGVVPGWVVVFVIQDVPSISIFYISDWH